MSTVCARRGLFSAEAIQAARAENRQMKKRDYAAKMAEGPRFRAANRTPGETRFRAADRTPALRRDEKVINRQESYQHAPASAPKKAEGKKRRSPCTPFREKGKGKEDRRGSSWNRLSRVGARVAAALDADLDTAVLAFGGSFPGVS